MWDQMYRVRRTRSAKKLEYDSGFGIRYWRNHYNGYVRKIDIALVKEGHCSEIHKRKTYTPKYSCNTPGLSLTV
jgi:hypothetical protein